jgi:uncharacterized protein YprB with RNaseH-like and TPR domain
MSSIHDGTSSLCQMKYTASNLVRPRAATGLAGPFRPGRRWASQRLSNIHPVNAVPPESLPHHTRRQAAAGLRKRDQEAARPDASSEVLGENAGPKARRVGPARAVQPKNRATPLYGVARTLHRRYAKMRLEERYELTVDRHNDMAVHRITQRTGIGSVSLPTPGVAQAALEGCLEVVYGIGPVTATTLRQLGVSSVRALGGQYPRHDTHAAEVVAEHDAGDIEAICGRLTRRLGEKGHLLSALSCSLVDPEEIVFLDLETMGLWNNVVFLAGFGRFEDGSFVVDQYLAPGFESESAVIALTLEQLAAAKVVVTYNGRTADLPWVRQRAFYFNLGPCPNPVHVDLMYGARRQYMRLEQRLVSCQLPLVTEHVLGIPRPTDDVESRVIPLVYEAYASDPEARQGMLIPILDHNRADLEAVALLLERLCAVALTGP